MANYDFDEPPSILMKPQERIGKCFKFKGSFIRKQAKREVWGGGGSYFDFVPLPSPICT